MKYLTVILLMAFTTQTLAVDDRAVIKGLDHPWAVVAAPDGNLWITEKNIGDIKIYNTQFVLQKTISGFPGFVAAGEAGLLDIAFHPRFQENNWVYVVYSVHREDGYRMQVNRFTVSHGTLQEQKTLIDGPASVSGNHFGSRLLFDDEGFLLITFGERLEKEKAQDLTQLHGKIVRLTDDGAIPKHNPFGRQSPIFSLGHRNPQGLAIHPVSRKLYDSEHGPSEFDAPGGGDEVNEIRAGGNYGWPLYHHDSNGPGMIAPLIQYTPAVAPSGMAFYTGNAIPKWKNDLFVACLRGQQLLRLRVDEKGQITETEALLRERWGRLRDVETSPDGSLLVLSEGGNLIQLK